jgi:UDP-glucose 4-epimerase
MRALVTGGAGFIGSHLVDRLLENCREVIVLDNFSTGHKGNLQHCLDQHQLQFIEVDVRDQDAIKPYFKNIDWVFHLAALADIVPSIQRPLGYLRAGADATVSVLEAAREVGVKKFVYAASSSCYGIPDTFPTPETAEIKPQYPYALAKNLGEQCVMHWASIYKMPVVSLRLFNVYGPRARTTGTYGAVFGVFLAQKLACKPYTVVGDGSQTRDFTYVSDVVEAFYRAATSPLCKEILNVGSSQTQSINRLVELLGGPVTYVPKRPGEPDCTFADVTRIKKLLNWEARISFEEGVSRMLENIDYWSDAPVWNPSSIEIATKEWFDHLG